jgi:subtilisin
MLAKLTVVLFFAMAISLSSIVSIPMSYSQLIGPDLSQSSGFNNHHNNALNTVAKFGNPGLIAPSNDLGGLYGSMPGLGARDNKGIGEQNGGTTYADEGQDNAAADKEATPLSTTDNNENTESRLYHDSALGSMQGKEGQDHAKEGEMASSSPSSHYPSNYISGTPSIPDRFLYSDSISSGILPSLQSQYSPSTLLPGPLPSAYPSSLLDSALGNIIPNQYIVVLKDDTLSFSDLLSGIAAYVDVSGTELLHTYENALKGFAIRVTNQMVVEALKRSPFVDHVEKDVMVQAFAQSMPKGINRVDGDLGPTRSGNGYGTVYADIAILDTGIQTSHPDLYVYRQKTFVDGTTSANDDNGHGTHVAGTAAARDNYLGVVGMAPGAKLWAIKVLDKNGSGDLSSVIKGIDYITQYASQIEVANLSLGCECKSLAFDTSINNAVKSGITFVVASGNAGRDASAFSPASNPNVIAVSSIVDTDGKCGGIGSSTGYGSDDSLASYSNYGQVVDIAAPGTSIYSTYKGSTYAYMTGTSMATAHVSGAAALYKATHPSSSPNDVRNALLTKGSTPSSLCDGNGHGYFANDVDGNNEPLLYVRNY